MNHLRLQKKGQLADLESRRKTLAAKADNAQISILQKVDTVGDASGIDSHGILTAATDLHQIVGDLVIIDTQITKLRDELFS